MSDLKSTPELIDSIIIDCDSAVKELVTHGYIGFCAKMVGIVQKLACAKAGYVNDMKNRNETIDALKAEIRRLGGTADDIPIDEFLGGDGNGSI